MSSFVIAEAGVNHNGSLAIAKQLVDQAKYAGADCIKFQTFISGNLTTKQVEKANYQKQDTNPHETQLEMLKKLELSFAEFIELNEYCKIRKIEFLSTAFDFESIDFLHSLGLTKWKIPSGEITNLPYLIKIAQHRKPTILSTGMSTMEEIRLALNVLKQNGANDVTVLHCTTEYPAPFDEVNLSAMPTIGHELGVPVGYSDHTKGIEISIAAVAMGARVIEKHFTLDRTMIGPDHVASIEPEEFKQMVKAIRNVEIALGNGKKEPSASEKRNIEIARKSIVAKCEISEGDEFTEDNLTIKRPGIGISPMKWFEVIGKRAVRNFQEDELIEL